MSPPYSKVPSVDQWWKRAYEGRDDIAVQYEMEHNGDLIKPGTVIKMKNMAKTFKFRCLAHNIKLDSTWIECIDNTTGEWRAFRVDKLKGVVKPKKSRRKKKNATVPTSA